MKTQTTAPVLKPPICRSSHSSPWVHH